MGAIIAVDSICVDNSKADKDVEPPELDWDMEKV